MYVTKIDTNDLDEYHIFYIVTPKKIKLSDGWACARLGKYKFKIIRIKIHESERITISSQIKRKHHVYYNVKRLYNLFYIDTINN